MIEMMSEEDGTELAVDVKNVVFQYKKGVNILNDLSLQIPKGKIFALLGPNGAGKTTLIRTILGRVEHKSGSVKVFGSKPGINGSGITAKTVGYMPQELAIFNELTIEEIFRYYGTIYHLNELEITQRISELSHVLHLPETNRFISKLSGGQKRRVSILITMIHKPKLIILDEPTVGVDSLLRHRIWCYLEDICQQNNQTVLITTHYIEEAKSAANVAFINYGKVLKQSDPQKLLEEYRCQSLETVFLKICENLIHKRNVSVSEIQAKEDKDIESDDGPEIKLINNNEPIVDLLRTKALLKKYWIVSLRNPLFLFIFFLLPFLSLTTIKLGMGQYPKNIPVVIFNDDQTGNYSQIIIDSIDKKHLDLSYQDNNRTAFESVVNGTNYMSIVFGQNFSDSFEFRIKKSFEMTDEELDSSQIKVYADFSNGAIGITLINYLLEAFNKFLKTMSTQFGYNADRYFHTVSVEQPIYGDFQSSLLNSIAPGVMITLAYCLPMAISALQLLYDRKDSSLERMLVSGVKPIEIMAANLIQNIILFGIQLIFTLFFAFFVYNFTQIGSYFDVYILLFLTGIQGTAVGFLIALLSKDETESFGITQSIINPLCLASGIFWPIEAYPSTVRLIVDFGPLSLPLQAFRSILLRGWTLTHQLVLMGFLTNIVYIIITNILNLILFNKLSK